MPEAADEKTGIASVDAGAKVVRTITNMSDSAFTKLLTFFVFMGIAVLIYIDRRDRMESQAIQIRSYESQGELNRQSITNNTTAVSTLTATVGKLDASVTELRREVTGLRAAKGGTVPLP